MRNREKANLTDFEKWELHDKFVLSVSICVYMHMYVFKLSRKTECNFSQCSTVTARITRLGNDDLLSFANNSINWWLWL